MHKNSDMTSIIVMVVLWIALGLWAVSDDGAFECQMDDVRPRSCQGASQTDR